MRVSCGCLRFRMIMRSLFFLVQLVGPVLGTSISRKSGIMGVILVNFRELRRFYLVISKQIIIFIFTWQWFSKVVYVYSMRLLLLGLRFGGLIELGIGVLVLSLLGFWVWYVHYDMTMYQLCDFVPSHALSRGDICVFVMYNEGGGVGCPHEHDGYDTSCIMEFHTLVRDSCIRC